MYSADYRNLKSALEKVFIAVSQKRSLIRYNAELLKP